MNPRTLKITGEHGGPGALLPSEIRQLSGSRAGDEANPLGVHQISKIQDQVNVAENRHHQLALPGTVSSGTVLGSSRVAVLPVKAEDGPNQRRAEVEDDGEEGVDDHKPVEWEAQGAGPSGNGQHDDHHGEAEAQAVHHHAVLGAHVQAVLAIVGQRPKNNAGHKTLDHFEQPGDGGHVSHHGPRFGPGEEDLSAVGEAAERGADSHGDAVSLDITALLGALRLEKVNGVDHGGGDVHERGQHGEGHSEVVPGYRHARVQPRDVQGEDNQGDGETEAPHKHAEVSVVGAVSCVVGHEGHDGAAEEQLAHPGQTQRGQDGFFFQVVFSASIHV